MKNHLLYIVCAAVSACVMLQSCNDPAKLRREFEMNTGGESLVVEGRAVLYFEEYRCQSRYSPDRVEFCVGDDLMNTYYILDADKTPAGLGSRIRGNLSWATDTQVKSRRGLEFEVVKVEGDKFWLWCRKARIGLVVRELH